MSALRHVMILASAGSGKTYALTNRFVELLAGGAAPERIVALTFTRKAAGEFFDEILKKLAGAASDSTVATTLGREIGHPELQTGDFLRLLRALTDAMHRLRLGTLDGFFARIARAFPFELGLTGEFELLEEHGARLERQRVLQRMFARAGELSGAQAEFIEAFKRATFGTEEKRLGARLDAYLDEHQEVFLAAPRSEHWGEHGRIWPQPSVWLAPIENGPAIAATLWAALQRGGLTEAQRARWEAFFVGLGEWVPGMPLPAAVEYILKNALAVWPALQAGRAEMTVERRKFLLEGEIAAGLKALLIQIVGGELGRHIATTRGIYAVLRGYEAVYHDTVRRAGRLTFGDVQRLLLPGDGRPVLAQGVEKEEQEDDGADPRLAIDYRLDGGIDHWLFDEFQDTSFGQWQVLRNLVDEAVQDPTGARSFFCVGDVKQAIYTWREGDHRLLREIFEHYNSETSGTIEERHLVESWRSGPALIEMVNAVFGAAEVLNTLFTGEPAQAWNREWREHRSAVPQREGQAALLLANDELGRWTTVLRLLAEIRPLERGLTCAVLVQKNQTARELAEFLRREGGVSAVADSDLRVCTDNPLGAALLALIQSVAHPGDTLAWEHVQMSPLGEALRAEGISTHAAASAHVLAQIHAEGFEGTLEFWLRRLERRFGPGAGFTRERARQIAAAAAAFDETGSRDGAEFIAFMADYTVRDAETPAAVRVMTVHKAKGLGFDVVLLPDLEGKKLSQAREGLAVHKAADRSVEWVLSLPPKLFWQQDEVLAAHMRTAEAEACYEKLALLYVAMTRAKRGLYAIIEPTGKSSSHNYPRWLSHALGVEPEPVKVGELVLEGTWASGEVEWFRAFPLQPPSSTPVPSELRIVPLPVETVRVEARRATRRPSGEKKGVLVAGGLFELAANSAADFGTAVHAWFAQVEWAIDGSLALTPLLRAPGVEELAYAEAMACLGEPALAGVWARPPGAAKSTVWRERPFEVVLEGVWVTGIYDRVVVQYDAEGRPLRATVFDFKTDAVSDEAGMAGFVARHAEQLNLYRAVAAVLLGLPRESVLAHLVLTKWRRLLPVPRETE